jgi:hypothetical protein
MNEEGETTMFDFVAAIIVAVSLLSDALPARTVRPTVEVTAPQAPGTVEPAPVPVVVAVEDILEP